MRDTLACKLFLVLKPKEIIRFGKFLRSPYFNRRQDVIKLFDIFSQESKNEFVEMTREKVWKALFSGQCYDRVQLNYLLNFFSERLEQFFACEELLSDRFQNRLLRCRAFRKRGVLPLSAEALRVTAETPETDNPALALVYAGVQALEHPDDETHFQRLKRLLHRHVRLFPPAEARDLYMTAINSAIRRHNRGERAYTREAFDLYREALDKGVLLENGRLPKYTFINILNLAQLLGEHTWSRQFLEEGCLLLPPADRDNTYRYGLAGYHFRRSEYEAVLALLREVEFSDVFIQLDARKMLLRSYFELGEWPALASLLDSFKAFLRRQKALGYHRDSYLNLIKFTQKLIKAADKGPAARKRLAIQIEAAAAVAEREWLLSAVTPGLLRLPRK